MCVGGEGGKAESVSYLMLAGETPVTCGASPRSSIMLRVQLSLLFMYVSSKRRLCGFVPWFISSLQMKRSSFQLFDCVSRACLGKQSFTISRGAITKQCSLLHPMIRLLTVVRRSPSRFFIAQPIMMLELVIILELPSSRSAHA